ncbi:hypothetical protein PN627_21580 [Parabacteroides distasonis]|nr:hypothetical protein [Parabacteroides distasonis]
MNFDLLNLFSFPLLEALSASSSGLILHAGQTAGKGGKGKETVRDFMEYPTRRAWHGGGLKGHLRFGKVAVQIHESVSMAVLDDQTTAVPLHGKISPTGIAGDAA